VTGCNAGSTPSRLFIGNGAKSVRITPEHPGRTTIGEHDGVLTNAATQFKGDRLICEKMDLPTVQGGMTIARFAKRLHLVPNGIDHRGRMFGFAMVGPGKNLDKFGSAVHVVVLKGHMRRRADHSFLLIELPGVRQNLLESRLFAGFHVVGHDHRLRGIGPGLFRLGGVTRQAVQARTPCQEQQRQRD